MQPKPTLLLCGILIILSATAQPISFADPAQRFTASLRNEQQAKALFPFTEMNRYDWSYLPASMVPRTGIALRDLDSNQHHLFYAMLQAFLSPGGMKRANQIMHMEYFLKQVQPENPNRIPENYFISVYGHPSADSIWGWKFTGHHMTLNFTLVKDQLSVAPFFFGVYPAEVPDGPDKGLRILQQEEDLGFELIHSLSTAQQAQAIFQLKAFTDIVTTNSQQTGPLPVLGIAASGLNTVQKNKLNQLINTYLSSMPPLTANWRMKKISTENPEEIHFGWAGGLSAGIPHYYRIQGKTFLIEFDNTQNNANHIHSVWRDYYGDYGADMLWEHYHEEHRQ